MPSKPHTRFNREALSDGKASKTRTGKSEGRPNAEELVRTGLERKEQIRKTANKDGAEPLYFPHI